MTNMQWQKRGLIYNAAQHVTSWAAHTALTPTPIVLKDRVRVYFSALDQNTVGRIRYADLALDDPTRVLSVSAKPALDIGRPGSFDDNGVILGDIFWKGSALMMCYVGFQKVSKVKFLAFSGLACSTNGGETFERVSEAPILDRSDEGLYIRAIHSVLFEEGVYKIWYAAGNHWQLIDGKPYPAYQIHYLEATDLMQLPKQGKVCLTPTLPEYRIGRPRVYKANESYTLFFTRGATDKSYYAGFATSQDGITWKRHSTAELGIHMSTKGFDSLHLCYPALFNIGTTTYMIYNGNHMGHDGFGLAELAHV